MQKINNIVHYKLKWRVISKSSVIVSNLVYINVYQVIPFVYFCMQKPV